MATNGKIYNAQSFFRGPIYRFIDEENKTVYTLGAGESHEFHLDNLYLEKDNKKWLPVLIANAYCCMNNSDTLTSITSWKEPLNLDIIVYRIDTIKNANAQAVSISAYISIINRTESSIDYNVIYMPAFWVPSEMAI